MSSREALQVFLRISFTFESSRGIQYLFQFKWKIIVVLQLRNVASIFDNETR